jgi:cell division protein FtsW (lipid II flippase)
MRRRNIELILLLLALALGIGALALVQLGTLGHLGGTMLALEAVLASMLLCGHLLLRIQAPDADPFLVPIATLLSFLGIAQIHRLDIANELTGWDAAGVRQVVWAAIAIVLAFAVLLALRNHRWLLRYRYLAGLAGLVLLLLPLVPFLRPDGVNAWIWIRVGPLSFQPGEIAKLLLAVFFAGYLVEARDSLAMVGRRLLGFPLPRARDLGPILIVWILAMVVLVGQRDLGTSLLYFGLFLVMIYLATGRASWIILGLLLFGLGAWVAAQLFGYVGNRFTTWLDAFNPAYAQDQSYQLVQGIFGLADGGLIGTGLGRGRPDIVPLAESDFIIASLGEELGLAGLFAIFALYLVFISRGFRIGFTGQDDFGRLLGAGLAFTVALQVFIVVGGVTRVIPLTGLTTPFLAAGGSSLVANWIIVALLLRLSDAIRSQPRWVIEA